MGVAALLDGLDKIQRLERAQRRVLDEQPGPAGPELRLDLDDLRLGARPLER